MSEPPKTVPVQEAVRLVRAAQAAGETVVMCHGCFDIVHPGHVRHLQHAARQGGRLLVTLSGDRFVGKGEGRPLIPHELRAENLAALDCVDWVTVSDAPTAVELLETIRPDVYVKGREYEHNRDPRFRAERETVERYGGRVVFTSGEVIFSSTALIASLEDAAGPSQASTIRRLLDQYAITPETIDPLIGTCQGRRVLVVGEVIKDTYVMCDRPDVAGESPVMTLRPNEYRSFDGGAAIIARHLAALGARPTLVTGLPRTAEAEALRQRLAHDGVETRWIELDQPHMEKQRFLVGTNKVLKLDLGGPLTLDAAHRQALIELAAESAAPSEAAIIADYGQGLLTSALLGDLCAAVRPEVDLLVGDVSGRRSSLHAFRQMDLICPSESEIRDALHDYDDGLSSVVWRILHETRSAAAIVTLGHEGLTAFEDGVGVDGQSPGWSSRLRAVHVPALGPPAIDALGCGDALLAAATLARLVGGSLAVASILGGIAAAAQTQRLGNAVIGAAELRAGVRRLRQAQLTVHTESASTWMSRISDQLRVRHA